MSIQHELCAINPANWQNAQQFGSLVDSCPMQYCDKGREKENMGPSKRPELHQSKYKTELCKNWEEKGFCSYGTKCRFAHGVDELNYRDKQNCKYKSRPCQSFFSTMYCPYGNRCLFKHDERKIGEIVHSYYGTLIKFPFLREKAEKRRLPVFTEVLDEEEKLLGNIYRAQEKSVEKMVYDRDTASFERMIELA